MTHIPAAVRRYVRTGRSVVPQFITPASEKRPYFSWKRYQSERPTLSEIEEWHRRFPDAAWAMVTGSISGLVVLDFDGDVGEELRERLGLVPHVRSQGGGSHVYVTAPDFAVKTIPRPDTARFPGLDVKAEGGLATFYGRGPHGTYRRVASRRVYALPELSSALRALIDNLRRDRDPTPASFDFPIDFEGFTDGEVLVADALEKAAHGEPRNVTGFWLACQARDEQLEESEALNLALEYQRAVTSAGDHPYTPQEAYDSVRSAFSQPPRLPRALANQRGRDFFARTDLGNSERLVARHGQDLRFSHERDDWLIWDGRCWAPDVTGEVERKAVDTVRSIRDAARLETEESHAAALRQFGRRSESRGSLSAMVHLAKSRPSVAVRAAHLDVDPWLLNLLNGTLDLKARQLRPHDPADLITRLAPVVWKPRAESPRWEGFLRRVMPHAADRAFLQRAVGYSLTGDVSEHVLLVLWGTGANGKSVFLRTLQHMFGTYAQQAPVDLLVARRPSGGPSPEIARLAGARFVAATETEEGARLAEALVKQLTGGDRAVARQLYHDYVEFDPTHKLWLATNHKPQVRGTDEAMWRRLRLVPFAVTIPEDERDPDLYDKLLSEAPGILRWAVRGLDAWQRDGLGDSPSVRAATEQYRQEQDFFGQFIEECCVTGPLLSAPASELYQEYQLWADRNGLKAMTQQSFGRKLAERGFSKKRVGTRKVHTWRGITVRRDAAGPQSPKVKDVVTDARKRQR